jgi:multidrug efflux pump subunit AcrB
VRASRTRTDAARAGRQLGYLYEFGGEEETSVEANQSIAEKVPIAALIMLLLLILQFNSFRRPLIIVLTIPLGLIGRDRGAARRLLRRVHHAAGP